MSFFVAKTLSLYVNVNTKSVNFLLAFVQRRLTEAIFKLPMSFIASRKISKFWLEINKIITKYFFIKFLLSIKHLKHGGEKNFFELLPLKMRFKHYEMHATIDCTWCTNLAVNCIKIRLVAEIKR